MKQRLTKKDHDFVQWLEDHKACYAAIEFAKAHGAERTLQAAKAPSLALAVRLAFEDGVLAPKEASEILGADDDSKVRTALRKLYCQVEFVDVDEEEITEVRWPWLRQQTATL